jgi:hypothetical protein
MPPPQYNGYFSAFVSMYIFLSAFAGRVLEHVPERRLLREQVIQIAKSLGYPPVQKLIKMLLPFDPRV